MVRCYRAYYFVRKRGIIRFTSYHVHILTFYYILLMKCREDHIITHLLKNYDFNVNINNLRFKIICFIMFLLSTHICNKICNKICKFYYKCVCLNKTIFFHIYYAYLQICNKIICVINVKKICFFENEE